MIQPMPIGRSSHGGRWSWGGEVRMSCAEQGGGRLSKRPLNGTYALAFYLQEFIFAQLFKKSDGLLLTNLGINFEFLGQVDHEFSYSDGFFQQRPDPAADSIHVVVFPVFHRQQDGFPIEVGGHLFRTSSNE